MIGRPDLDYFHPSLYIQRMRPFLPERAFALLKLVGFRLFTQLWRRIAPFRCGYNFGEEKFQIYGCKSGSVLGGME